VNLLAYVHAVANRQTLWCPQAAAVANVQVVAMGEKRRLSQNGKPRLDAAQGCE
jgi:hypothetical protein